MKACYTSFDGVKATKDISNVVSALRALPVRAAGYAMIGIFCPNDDMYLDVVKIQNDGGVIKVEFGNSHGMDTIEAYLQEFPTCEIEPSPEF